MKRDFTSEAEENILDYCNMHEEDETWSPVETFGTIKIEEYIMNSYDINYCMNNIEIHHAMYMESQLYNEQFVHDVFADVRECDHQYAVIAEDYRVNAMDYYIESMKALYESIRVTAPGESSVSLQQIANARETYGRYGEVDGNCSSIFNNTGSFNNAIQSAGDGAITPTVQRIEENGGIEALAMKSADDITMWEVAL